MILRKINDNINEFFYDIKKFVLISFMNISVSLLIGYIFYIILK